MASRRDGCQPFSGKQAKWRWNQGDESLKDWTEKQIRQIPFELPTTTKVPSGVSSS